MRFRHWEIILLPIVLLGLCCYDLVGQTMIAQLYEGTAPSWLMELINTVYPRFAVEKHRFELSFFQEKAWQLLTRASFVVLVGIVCSLSYKYIASFRVKLDRFWNQKSPVKYAGWVVKLYFLGLLVSIPDWVFSLYEYTNLSEFYQPIPLFQLLHIPLVNKFWLSVFLSIFLISCLLALANKFVKVTATIGVGLFVFFQAYFLCFGKVVHTYSPIIYASLLMPFFTSDWADARDKDVMPTWSLKLIQLGVSFNYFYGGLEKLFTSQLTWLTGSSLQSHLLLSENSHSLWVAQQAWLCQLGSILIVVWQLGFPLAVFMPKWAKPILLLGIIFHWSTYLFLGVGGWISPWMVSYLFWLPYFFNSRHSWK